MITTNFKLERRGSNQWLQFLIKRISSLISNDYTDSKSIFLLRYFRENLLFYQKNKDFFENRNLTMLAIYSYCVTLNKYSYQNFEDIRIFLDCKELVNTHASRLRELRFNRDIEKIKKECFFINYNKIIGGSCI